MARYVFWAQVAEMQFIEPRSQAQGIFQDFSISLDLSYDLGENEVLFVKIVARVLDLRLDLSFGVKWPKCNLQAPDPKVKAIFQTFMILLDSSYGFGENEESCLCKWELGLEPMARCIFWAQVVQMQFLGPIHQGH